MITLRYVFLFVFVALLSGCAAHSPCPDPGHPSAAKHSCWYRYLITGIDNNNGTVTGIYPPDLGYKPNPGEPKPEPATFRVRDLDLLTSKSLLQQGHVYVFTNGYGSPYLEAFPEGYDFKSGYEEHYKEPYKK
jgi:hypothetical protein